MDLSPYLQASGVRVHAGEGGETPVYENVGAIWVARPALHGIDTSLWAILKSLVDSRKLWIKLSSIDTGKHVPGSRHGKGCAADVYLITAVKGTWQAATLLNSYAHQAAVFLRGNGFEIGEHPGKAGFLWGPVGSQFNVSRVDHSTHQHISVAPRPLPGAEEEGGEPAEAETLLDCEPLPGQKYFQQEEGRTLGTVQQENNSPYCLSSLKGRAARLHAAFPSPFPSAQPRWTP